MAAIWLCVVAPTVSRTLHAHPALAMPGCGSMGLDETHGHHLGTPAVPAHDGDACGYCTLFGHSPGLLFDVVAPMLVALQPPRQTLERAHLAAPRLLLLSAAPRGPPVA
ncbi:MAG: DUF2946 domain-containing protein [Rhodanobacter sp.]